MIYKVIEVFYKDLTSNFRAFYEVNRCCSFEYANNTKMIFLYVIVWNMTSKTLPGFSKIIQRRSNIKKMSFPQENVFQISEKKTWLGVLDSKFLEVLVFVLHAQINNGAS